MTLTLQERIDNYVAVTKYPRSLFLSEDGRMVGTWIMGNAYGVKSGYYGGYPAGYLARIKAMFPDKQKVLHLFSGCVDQSVLPGDTIDINPDREPAFVCDAHDLSGVDLSVYDLVLADPPYSVEDCDHYQTTMVKRNVIMRELAKQVRPGTHVVWLDQVLPMYRKIDWRVDGVIGMVKSTNHRFRVVTIFHKIKDTNDERF